MATLTSDAAINLCVLDVSLLRQGGHATTLPSGGLACSGHLTLMTAEIPCKSEKFSATEKQAEARSLARLQLHSAAELGTGAGLAADLLLQSIDAALALTGRCGQ